MFLSLHIFIETSLFSRLSKCFLFQLRICRENLTLVFLSCSFGFFFLGLDPSYYKKKKKWKHNNPETLFHGLFPSFHILLFQTMCNSCFHLQFARNNMRKVFSNMYGLLDFLVSVFIYCYEKVKLQHITFQIRVLFRIFSATETSNSVFFSCAHTCTQYINQIFIFKSQTNINIKNTNVKYTSI